MLYQNKLFTKDEVYKIRNYITKLDDRVIGTLHPDINDGKHDPQGGHNLAQHKNRALIFYAASSSTSTSSTIGKISLSP